MKRYLPWLAIVLFGLISAWAGYRMHESANSTPAESPVAISGSPAGLLNAPLSDLQGQTQTLGRWSGKVLVVNFWATWCPPCREEIPGLSRVQQELGNSDVQIVGVAIDDAAQVREFLRTTPVSYPVVTAAADVLSLTADLGNAAQGLPFTVILDRQGKLSSVKLGQLSIDELRARLAALTAPKR